MTFPRIGMPRFILNGGATTIEARLAEPIGAVSPAVLRKVGAEDRRPLGFGCAARSRSASAGQIGSPHSNLDCATASGPFGR